MQYTSNRFMLGRYVRASGFAPVQWTRNNLKAKTYMVWCDFLYPYGAGVRHCDAASLKFAVVTLFGLQLTSSGG